MATYDFKKEYKGLYLPKSGPGIVDVPEMLFLMVDGKGDPNTAAAYQQALEALYGLSYTIKMSKMGPVQPEGYFDYVVPPLEGLWRTADGNEFDGSKPGDKDRLCWTSMIRQPAFVTEAALASARAALAKKKPGVDTSIVRLCAFTEGLCVQMLHVGPYDDEPATVAQMKAFVAAEGYREDFSNARTHHEIYMGDPRKTVPEKLKTILRHPVAI